MSKILGVDLGNNSIGWAIVDDVKNITLNYGVTTFKDFSKNKKSSKKNNAILNLNLLIAISILFCILNYENWQFWLNIILTTFIAKITLRK